MTASPSQVARAKTMPVDIDDFKSLIDAVDTRFGHDTLVADLIGTLDRMVEMLENNGKVYRKRKHQRAGVSGYRNVHWHKKSGKWTGRVGWTDATGKRHRMSTGYYSLAEDASVAVEELRKKHRLA